MRRAGLLSGLLVAMTALLTMAGQGQGATVVSHSPRLQVNAGTSYNWSGYVAETNLSMPENYVVADVKGQWQVPPVGPSPQNIGKTYSAIWVGMDGYGSVLHTTVEQIGTEEDYIDGVPSYYAWYEMYPAASHLIKKVVNSSDYMSAEVQYMNGRFILTLSDLTEDWTFSTSVQLNKAVRSSAEWVVEAPGNIISPLADFGVVRFTGCSAVLEGIVGSINKSSWQNTSIDMVNTSGAYKAETSPLDHTGDAFSVTFQSSK